MQHIFVFLTLSCLVPECWTDAGHIAALCFSSMTRGVASSLVPPPPATFHCFMYRVAGKPPGRFGAAAEQWSRAGSQEIYPAENAELLVVPRSRLKSEGARSFSCYSPCLWTSVPSHTRFYCKAPWGALHEERYIKTKWIGLDCTRHRNILQSSREAVWLLVAQLSTVKLHVASLVDSSLPPCG